MAQIRQRGYEVMPSLQTSGVYNLSAPILGPDGSALAALTCPYIPPLRRPKAPDITEAILSGRHPISLTASKLLRDGALPADWPAQRAALGFA